MAGAYFFLKGKNRIRFVGRNGWLHSGSLWSTVRLEGARCKAKGEESRCKRTSPLTNGSSISGRDECLGQCNNRPMRDFFLLIYVSDSNYKRAKYFLNCLINS